MLKTEKAVLWSNHLWPGGCRAWVISTFHTAAFEKSVSSPQISTLSYSFFFLIEVHSMLILSVMWAFWMCGSLEYYCQGHVEWIRGNEIIKKSSLKLGNRSLMCNPSLINGIMVWVLSTLHFPPLLLSLLTQSAWKQPFQSLASMKSVPENLQCSCNGDCDNCTNQEKNCHYWNWEECLFWDGASTVLAEKFNNVAHVCVGIAVQQEIALEEKEKRLWGIFFSGWVPLPQTFHYYEVGKIGRKVLLIGCFKTQWKSKII